MDIIKTLFNVISEFGGYVLGFFSSFIEAVSSQLSAGNVFVAVLLVIFIWIKIKKMT